MKKSFPEYSVLMSVYVKEKPIFLEESLESILRQTISPKEVVLVEDGPITEELKQIISNFEKKMNIIDVVLEKNKGLGNALRVGTKKVTTNWILRMDSDDISIDVRAELQLTEVLKNPQLAVIGGQLTEFSGNVNNVIGKRTVPLSRPEICEFIKFRCPFNHPTVMINKKILLDVNGYEDYYHLEDYFLWIKIVSSGYDVKNIEESLLFMRVEADMYERRAGKRYLKQYLKLRKYMRKKRIITINEQVIGDVVMGLSVLIPSWLRRWVYQNALHRKG